MIFTVFFYGVVLSVQMVFYCTVPLLNCISIVLVFLDSHFHLQTLDQLPVVFKFGYSEEKHCMTTNAPSSLLKKGKKKLIKKKTNNKFRFVFISLTYFYITYNSM